MSSGPHLRVAAETKQRVRLTGDHWWDPDRERHIRDRPKYCPDCASGIEEAGGIAVEYWEGERRIFHTWCGACGWAGDIVRVDRMIGHEPEQ